MFSRIRPPSFWPWNKPADMRLRATFQDRTGMSQYTDYLDRYPHMKGVTYNRVLITPYEEKLLRDTFFFARSQYMPEDGDHWDHTLPGDCENQCLFIRRYAQQVLRQEIFNAMRLVICRVNKQDERAHAILCFDEVDKQNKLTERLMDFKLTEPFLPVGHRAFDSYTFFKMHKPGTNEWHFASRVKA